MFLSSVPSLLGLTLLITLFAVAIHYVLLKKLQRFKWEFQSEIATAVYATISVVYAVVIGLLVIIGQERRDTASHSIISEAAILDDLTHASGVFGHATSQSIHSSVISYTETIINVEWALLMNDADESVSNKPYEKLWKDILHIIPADQHQNTVYSAMVGQLHQLSEARYSRINAASDHLTVFLWIVLLSGGIALVVFPWMFSSLQTVLHLILTAVTTAAITLVLLLVLAYDNPLSGVVALERQPYEALLNDIRSDIP